MPRISSALFKKFYKKDRSEVNFVIKYLLFTFNTLFWLIACCIIVIGIWAKVQKNNLSNLSHLTNIDPVSLLIIGGVVIFIVAFFGCIGSLRENICFLSIYISCLIILLLLLITAAIIAFAFKGWLKDTMASSLQSIIPLYRDDIDLQNLIDWIQSEWLMCCGVVQASDWEQNIYFNCSSPGVEACGVPYSCCKPLPNVNQLTNFQCGYGVLKAIIDVKIWPTGCVEAGQTWFTTFIIPIAGTLVTVVVFMILGVCCSLSLIVDIRAQKAKWRKSYGRYE